MKQILPAITFKFNINLILKYTLLIFFSTIGIESFAQKNVLTQHNDLSRTGWYDQEKILNTKNVQPGVFGKIFTRVADDQIYAQPLVMLNLTLPSLGKKNVVFVATVNNTVYAFDADSAKITEPYWTVNLSPQSSRAPTNKDMTGACGGFYNDFSGKMGIVGTPVIDSVTNTLYVVARSVNTITNVYQQYLHALDITTGAEKANSPKLITAQTDGFGEGHVNGKIIFDAQKQNQRPGLLLLNGILYIGYSSHCDWGPYHGWVLGYDTSSLEQKVTYNTTPEGYFGGIWMSGAAPAADGSGNIYLAVGNGSIGKDGNPTDVTNRSESAIKLTRNESKLTVSSYFSPVNIDELEAGDLDFGVTQLLLIPGTNIAMTAAKDGRIYVLDRDNMGGFSANTNNVIQTIELVPQATLRSSLGYYKGQNKEFVYSWSENYFLQAYPLNRNLNKFDLDNTISSIQGPQGASGAFLSVSSNGSVDSTAILWATYAANGDANQSVRPGILRAFDANDVTKELWNSSQYAGDSPGNYAKFNNPTIINGKVYLGTFSNELAVYGLTGKGPDTCNSPNAALNKPAVGSSVEGNDLPAAAAVDGNLNTRWASAQGIDPQSIFIDLGKRYDFCKVVLKWEVALGKNFQIQTSDDATNWTTLSTVTDNPNLENYFYLKASGRYVRMLGTERGTPYGYSLYEFEVYGTESEGACNEPANLTVKKIAETSANVQWVSTVSNSFTIQYKTLTATTWKSISANLSSATLQGLACNTAYVFRVQGNCNIGGKSKFSETKSFTTSACNTNCGGLPTRWYTDDIGDVGIAGSACYEKEIFELRGSGKDVSTNEDAVRIAYKTLLGDGEIKARILTTDLSNALSKTGIMIRETLMPGSRFAFIGLTGTGVVFQNRTTVNGIYSNVNLTGIKAPYWVKLVKKGSIYTAFTSADGNIWKQLGSEVNNGFGNGIPVYAGLSITSQGNTILSSATVDNYQFSGIVEVELISFDASLTLNKTIQVDWKTSLENNVRDFVIERSADNVHYIDIDTILAQNKGKANETYKYTLTNPSSGFNYFRLRITGEDGKITYTAPVFVRITESKAPIVYPNPSKGTFELAAGTEPIKFITVYDVSGRLVKKFVTIVEDPIKIYLLENGVYILDIRTAVSVYKQKIVVIQ